MSRPPSTQWPRQPWGLSPRPPRARRVHTAWHPGLCIDTQAQLGHLLLPASESLGKVFPAGDQDAVFNLERKDEQEDTLFMERVHGEVQ